MNLPVAPSICGGSAKRTSTLASSKRERLRSASAISLADHGLLAMIGSFAAGHVAAQSYLRYGEAHHSIQIDKEPEPRQIKIIRAGDKGVLYYDPQAKQLNFVRWDAIKKLTSTR